jgi:hypothetical protein
MEEYKREYPLFALCGLNCGLCPRFHTEGSSRCPGCGGKDFHLKHPACAVITCNKKNDNGEYCFQCSLFPCNRYKEASKVDSFISYRNVLADFIKAKKAGVAACKSELNEKVKILEYLIANYDDGRKKGFYCIGVNLLDLSDLKEIMKEEKKVKNESIDTKEKIKSIVDLFNSIAEGKKIELKLRK